MRLGEPAIGRVVPVAGSLYNRLGPKLMISMLNITNRMTRAICTSSLDAARAPMVIRRSSLPRSRTLSDASSMLRPAT